MITVQEIDEILNEICFAPIPYEARVRMCAAVVRAARNEYLRKNKE